MVLDLKFLAHFPHHFVIQVGAIVYDNLPRQTITEDNLTMKVILHMNYESTNSVNKDISLNITN